MDAHFGLVVLLITLQWFLIIEKRWGKKCGKEGGGGVATENVVYFKFLISET